MYDDDELKDIRLKKQRELENNLMKEQLDMENKEKEQFEQEKKNVLRQILSPEARERLGRIRLVKPDLAENVENQLISLAMTGKIRNVIDDDTLKKILERMIPERKETKIVRR